MRPETRHLPVLPPQIRLQRHQHVAHVPDVIDPQWPVEPQQLFAPSKPSVEVFEGNGRRGGRCAQLWVAPFLCVGPQVPDLPLSLPQKPTGQHHTNLELLAPILPLEASAQEISKHKVAQTGMSDHCLNATSRWSAPGEQLVGELL